VSEPPEPDFATSVAVFSIVDGFKVLGLLLGAGCAALGLATFVAVEEDTEGSEVPDAFGAGAIAGGFDTVSGGLGPDPRSKLLGEACTGARSFVLTLAWGVGIELIGPKITLDGTVFGAGLGMYGCLTPADSETVGIFLGGGEGLSIPFDSPKNFGLSSQLEEIVGVDGLAETCFSNGLSTLTDDTDPGLSSDFVAIIIGGLGEMFVEEAVGTGTGCLSSTLGGATLGSRSEPVSASFVNEDLTGEGGPASSGVLKAFSQEPGLGSVGAGLGCAGGGIGPT
jgi:hypothetical protein